MPALRSTARAAQQHPPPPTPARFQLPDLLWAARNAHAEFRNRNRLEEHLGWPHRKLVWLEHGRIKPTQNDLAQLTAALPLLRILLERMRRPQREIETAGRL